jgi:glutamate-1-semialdehyde 2,1-aminomutase
VLFRSQQYFGVRPDITVFGKILGGGFPVGAFSGSTEIMEHLNSLMYKRPHYSFHGGTFSANPITMTAGLATLKQLENGRITNDLNKKGARIRQKLTTIFEKEGMDCQVVGVSSIFNTHFTKKEVKNAVDASRANRKRLLAYELALIASGVFLLPTHNGVISSTHSDKDFEKLFAETEKFARQATH